MTLQLTPLPFSCPIYSPFEAPGYTNIHLKPTDYAPHQSCFTQLLLLGVKKVWSLSQHTLLPVRKNILSHSIMKQTLTTDNFSLFQSYLWAFWSDLNVLWVATCVSMCRTYHFIAEVHMGARGVTKTWHPTCVTHSGKPDTSDLCHLICDSSEWQRGRAQCR